MVNRQIDRQAGRQAGRQTDRRIIDRQRERETDRQTDMHVNNYPFVMMMRFDVHIRYRHLLSLAYYVFVYARDNGCVRNKSISCWLLLYNLIVRTLFTFGTVRNALRREKDNYVLTSTHVLLN